MPVGELRRRMTAMEYMQWGIYYGRKAQQQQLEMAKAK